MVSIVTKLLLGAVVIPFTLTTGYTTYEVIPDESIAGVRNAKDGHYHVTNVVGPDIRRYAGGNVTGSSRASSECQGVVDCDLREVDVDLSSIDSLATEVILHEFGGNTCAKSRLASYLHELM